METTTFVCPSLGFYETCPPTLFRKFQGYVRGSPVGAPCNLRIPYTRKDTFIVPSERKPSHGPNGHNRTRSHSPSKIVAMIKAQIGKISGPKPFDHSQYSDTEDDVAALLTPSVFSGPIQKRPAPNGTWNQYLEEKVLPEYIKKESIRDSVHLPDSRPIHLLPTTFVSEDRIDNLADCDVDNLCMLQHQGFQHLCSLAETVLPQEFRDTWKVILCRLAWTCAQRVNPKFIPSMDVLSCVRILNIPVGNVVNSEYVPGIVFRKHIADVRMPKTIHNGRIVLLGGSVDVERNGQVVDLQEYAETELRNSEFLFNVICQWKPDVVLVENNMHHNILTNLCIQGVVVATFVKRVVLEKVAASTGASIIDLDSALGAITMRGVEHIVADVNPCGNFKLFHSFSEIGPSLIYLVPRDDMKYGRKVVQATMILRGASSENLKIIKKALAFLSRSAFNLFLESHFYQDIRLRFPSPSTPPPQDSPSSRDAPLLTTSMHANNVISSNEISAIDPSKLERYSAAGAFDPIFQQQLLLHRTRILSSAPETDDNEKSPVGNTMVGNVEFHLCSLNFYDRSKNDVTLSEALNEWMTKQQGDDKGPRWSVIHYAHREGVVAIRVQQLESEKERIPSVVTWSKCSRCDSATPRSVLSFESQKYSFGKVLENFYYNNTGTAPCGHSYFQENTLYFAKSADHNGEMITVCVSMTYSQHRPYHICKPDLTITGDTCIPEKMFTDELIEINEIAQETFTNIRRIFEDIISHKAFANVPPGSPASERLDALRTLALAKLSIAVDHETTLAKQFEEIVNEASVNRDFLALNRHRKALYEELRDWNKHIGEVWALYLSPELQALVNDPNDMPSSESGFFRMSASSKKTNKFASPALKIPEKSSVAMGNHFSCGGGANRAVVIVRESEPTSVIAFALNSIEYERFSQGLGVKETVFTPQLTEDLEETRPHERTASMLDPFMEDQQDSGSPRNSFSPTNRGVAEAEEALGDTETEKGKEKMAFPPLQQPSEDTAIGSLTPEQLQVLYINLNDKQRCNFEYHITDRDDPNVTFTCAVYFAKQFEALRMMYTGGNDKQFIASLSRSVPFFPSGGKSGSTFVKTRDERYILKQVSQVEMEHFLKTFAPEYFEHMCRIYFFKYQSSLVKVLGAYRMSIRSKSKGAQSAYYILMENLFFGRKISRAYDLKGSLRNRFQPKANSVSMDENLLHDIEQQRWIYVVENDKEKLNLAVYNDTLLLNLQRIMDYSLLVGVEEETNTIVIGIVDYFREYDLKKLVESVAKSTAGKQPTIIHPSSYKKRFRTAMKHYFPLMPNKLTPWVIQHNELFTLVDKVEENSSKN
eukprot:PhF_6_TR10046/c0_g1_i1/m.15476/K00921/PIKFYVE, FAB1; 1-phosphatidylinositol-3-phosphate 5-kinase